MKIEKVMLDDSAYMNAYIADETELFTRKAILIIPGGAYSFCSSIEGEPIALAFMSYGFNAFVLNYSVNREKALPAQLIQASKAVKHIKDNAEEFGIEKEEVYIVGFSAGGHLAASLGRLWHKKEIYEAIQMPYGYNKPKGMILVYPVITGMGDFSHKASFRNLLATDEPTLEQLEEASIELHVSEKACPVYMVHAANDASVPVENSLILAMQYSKQKIPFEMHIYPSGEHAFSLANKITWRGNPKYIQDANASWVEDAVKWTDKLY